MCALMMAGHPPPPKTTALGGLLHHLGRKVDDFQPSNITWAHVAPMESTGKKKLKKRDRYQAMAERAIEDIAPWLAAIRSAG